jgi:hypothetical protein
MRRALLLVVGAALLAGCVAETVEKKKPRRGPVPEVGIVDPGGGEVRYSTEGWDLIVSGRRLTAKRKMKRVCKPLKAKIVDEYTREDIQVPYSGDDLAANMEKGLEHYEVSPYHHIVFECLPQEAPLLKPQEKKKK